MIFGDKARFAIEFTLNDEPGGAWLFGKFCYWIDGNQIGSYDEGISLRDILFQMKYIVGDAGIREAPTLAALDDRKIFDFIQEAMDESGERLFMFIPRDFLPARFDICIHVDIFNAWDIYLVEGIKFAKIVYSNSGVVGVSSVELRSGEFEAVAASVYEQLDALYQKFI